MFLPTICSLYSIGIVMFVYAGLYGYAKDPHNSMACFRSGLLFIGIASLLIGLSAVSFKRGN